MQRYLDHDLDQDETAQLFSHISACPDCERSFQALKALSQDLSELPAVTPPFSLVDSILPQLDAIDLARKNDSIFPQLDAIDLDRRNQEQPELRPRIKRSDRTPGWWSGIAGRTAIGSAAAALILGVAVYIYQPQKLSEAEIAYEEQNNNALQTNQGRGMENLEVPESADSAVRMKKSDEGGTENTESLDSAMGISATEEAPVSSEMMGTSDKKAAAQPSGDGGQGAAQTKRSDQQNKERSESESTQYQDERQSFAGESRNNAEIQDKGTNHAANPPGGGEPASAASEETRNGDKSGMGIMGNLGPQQWRSPDGLYSVSLEIDKLTVYRHAGPDGTEMEVFDSIPVQGRLVSGLWAGDGRTFTYTTLTDQREVQHTYSPEQSKEKKQQSIEQPRSSSDEADKDAGSKQNQ